MEEFNNIQHSSPQILQNTNAKTHLSELVEEHQMWGHQKRLLYFQPPIEPQNIKNKNIKNQESEDEEELLQEVTRLQKNQATKILAHYQFLNQYSDNLPEKDVREEDKILENQEQRKNYKNKKQIDFNYKENYLMEKSISSSLKSINEFNFVVDTYMNKLENEDNPNRLLRVQILNQIKKEYKKYFRIISQDSKNKNESRLGKIQTEAILKYLQKMIEFLPILNIESSYDNYHKQNFAISQLISSYDQVGSISQLKSIDSDHEGKNKSFLKKENINIAVKASKNKSKKFKEDKEKPSSKKIINSLRVPKSEDIFSKSSKRKKKLKEETQQIIKSTKRKNSLPSSDLENELFGGDIFEDDEFYKKCELEQKEQKMKALEKIEEDKKNKLDESNTIFDRVKRDIDYKIQKNKGLTRKRKKIDRNPRVKNRDKYQRALIKHRTKVKEYEGGHKNYYYGEETGIRANVIKSTKL